MTVAPQHAESARIYDARFASGYMARWPAWKRTRVRDWLRTLALPGRGVALDFGCGGGVFTAVLMEALPGWRVVGADISTRALAEARERVGGAGFVPLTEIGQHAPFDLVFSHHVLEHVVDLEQTLDLLRDVLAPGGSAVHVLPCGNAGSLEERLCRLRRDGIDPGNGRFCFEEPGHLRRLDSAGLERLFGARGLSLAAQAYACHRAGAIQWITREGVEFVRSLADPGAAVDARAARSLRRLRRVLVGLARLRSLPGLRGPTERLCIAADAWEWRRRRGRRDGSEMYLHFRSAGAGTC
ncbi:MAG: class I SAM-dependent methyltransferase [Myxococcota bacterium]